MTDSKVIARLLEFAPPAIAAVSRVPNRCVLATHIGIEALRAFGLRAEPWPVSARFSCEAFERWRAAGFPEPAPPDAFTVEVGDHLADRMTAGPKSWLGHLVIHLPDREQIVDLETHQFHRPAKAILADPATVFPWPRGHDGVQLRTSTPPFTTVVYVARPENTAFLSSRDWTSPVDDVVAALVRTMRKPPAR